MNITENLSDVKIRFGSFSTPYKEYRLGDITDTISRPLKMDDDKEYLLVTVKRRNEGIVERGIYKGKEVKVKSQFKIEAGDFLISKRQIIHGACEIVPSKLAGAIVSNEYHILHGKRGLLLTQYLNLLSKTPKLKNYFALACVGVDIEKMLFRIEDWKKRVIKIPSIEEQQKIISFFELLNSKLKKQQEKIEKLEQFKKGMMQKIFSQELRFKAEDGGKFSKWEEKKLGQILKIKHGRDQKEIETTDGKFPILATGGTIGKTDTFIYDKESVLIGRKGTIDRPVYMNSPFWTVDTLFYSEIKESNHPKFVFYVFQNINWKLYNEASGVPSLSAKTIETIKVEVPTFEEQKVIADYLSVIDSKIEKEKEKLMVLEEQKRGFMQKMFV